MLDFLWDATTLKTVMEVLGFKLACVKASVVGKSLGLKGCASSSLVPGTI